MGSRFAARREQGHACQQCRDNAEDGRIRWPNSVEQAAEQAGDAERARNAERESCQYPFHAASQHQAEYIRCARAERHPDANLLRSLCH
jgi:hypothetical protein